MKKFVSVCVTTAMVALLMTGCGSSTAKEAPAAATAKEETTAAETASAETTAAETASAETTAEEGTLTIEKIKEKGTLVVVTDASYAPYGFIDTTSGNTDPIGIDIELAQLIADELGVTLVQQPMLFKDSIAAVTTGNADMAINGMTATDERREVLDLSEPYMECEDGFVVPVDKVGDYSSLEDFAGKKLSGNTGSPQVLKAQNLLPEFDLLEVDNIPASVLELLSGNTDGFVVEKRVGQQYVMAYDELEFSTVSLSGDSEVQSTKSVGMPKGTSPELMDLINKIIKENKENGNFQKWLDEYSEIAANMVLANK